MVIKVGEDNVHIDIKHPLPCVALNFDVQIGSVRDATKEELGHGHHHEEVITNKYVVALYH